MTRTTKLLLAASCAMAFAGAVKAQPSGGAAGGAGGVGGRGASATLYDAPNFQGRSITIYRSDDNLQNDNFNDVAQSAHFDGDWTVCSDAGLRGNCQTLSGDVPNLNRVGLGRAVSSLRQGSGYGSTGGGGYGRDPGADRGGYGDNGGDNRGGDRDDHGDDRGYGDNRGPGAGSGPVVGGPGPAAGGWQGGSEGVPGRSVVFFPRPKSDGQDIAAFDRTAADWFCRRQGLGAAVYYDTSTRGRGFRFNGGGFSINAPVLRDVVCRK